MIKLKLVAAIGTLLMLLVNMSAYAEQRITMQLASANPCSMKHSNPCNPCSMKHPKNPCNPCNPCGIAKVPDIDAKLVLRPANTKMYTGMSRAKLAKLGKKLFHDASLSPDKVRCADCHSTYDLFQASFAQDYPHPISMAKQRAGISKSLNVDEFVQFCMLAPMGAQPLPWNSKELAALSVYMQDVKQKEFITLAQANPCMLKPKSAANPCNPCAMKQVKNPCNPCAMKKAKNPCNPCAAKQAKNPCNPCAMKKRFVMDE